MTPIPLDQLNLPSVAGMGIAELAWYALQVMGQRIDDQGAAGSYIFIRQIVDGERLDVFNWTSCVMYDRGHFKLNDVDQWQLHGFIVEWVESHGLDYLIAKTKNPDAPNTHLFSVTEHDVAALAVERLGVSYGPTTPAASMTWVIENWNKMQELGHE